jgi:hypothetical protein
MSSNLLEFPNRLTGRRLSLALFSGGKPPSPAQLDAQIKRLLEIIAAEARFFAQRSPRWKHRRQEALPPLCFFFAECPPFVPVRLTLPCVAFACRRLVTAPAYIIMHMANRAWGWAEVVMDRVTRGRVRRVQVRLQRLACCAVRCACRASACVRCVFDVFCRKRWLIFRSVAADHSGCIKRAAAFILVCRLLLPPALQADPTFGTRHTKTTALLRFAI